MRTATADAALVPSADPGEDLEETVIVDTSAIIALLIDPGPAGRAVAERLHDRSLAAPDFLFAESANVLRKLRLRGVLSDTEASIAFADLMELPIDSWPFEAVADRAWSLRANVTSYDATFVALAQLLGLRLVTRDKRLARAVAASPSRELVEVVGVAPAAPMAAVGEPPAAGPAAGSTAGSSGR